MVLIGGHLDVTLEIPGVQSGERKSVAGKKWILAAAKNPVVGTHPSPDRGTLSEVRLALGVVE